MKKYLFFLGLLIMSASSNAQILISILLGDKLNTGQIEFGLEGGYNRSTIEGMKDAGGLNGFNLGFYFDIKLKNPSWMIYTGCIVKSPMGAGGLPVYTLNNADLDSSFNGGSVARKLRYFNVPFMLKYNLKNHFYVKGGIMLGLRSNCFDEFTNSIQDDEDLTYEVNTKDQFRLLDAGLGLGIGYRFMKGIGMNISTQYYYGLMDITIDDSKPGEYNRGLYVTLGIPIGKDSKKISNEPDQKK